MNCDDLKIGKTENSVDQASDLGQGSDETVQFDHLQLPIDLASHSGQNDNSQPGIMFVSGNETGQVHLLTAPRVQIGRSPDCQIMVRDASVSRQHLLLETTPEGVQAIDLKSRNGVFVNGNKIKRCWISPNDVIRIGPKIILRYSLFSNVELDVLRKMHRASTMDPLTLTYNRKYFSGHLKQLEELPAKKKRNLSLILIDIDYFKRINDTFGHQLGDQALNHIATIIRTTVRGDDIVCRYGGEEFTILLSDTSNTVSTEIAERIRNRIESNPLRRDGNTIRLTVSIGVAIVEEANGNLDNLFKLADARMYAAKRRGRNQVVSLQSSDDNVQHPFSYTPDT
ncbi:GGDEF domain-containing protein [Pseudovibrio sp. Alg231-02]|uniref:GGDEF domain-containing protein n=1 Tax=Pseudovibrio sp. Alg231-02 TaxID=1922223 RepID=UPI000D54B2EE|nr:GGDEF domain-containing protein [Pseudovibrio sp. Alg231-02]